MDAGELVAAYRQRSDDETEPFLISRERALYFASEAEKEACVRSDLIWDETSDFLSIDVVDGQATYQADNRITRIDRAVFVPLLGQARGRLELTGLDILAERDPGFRRTSWPSALARRGNTLRLWPTPNIDGQLMLSVYRLPLYPMGDESDEPEIPPEHHDQLIDWMLYLTYSTKDADVEDAPRAMRAEQRFAMHFGERPNTETLRHWRERRRITTTYGGY